MLPIIGIVSRKSVSDEFNKIDIIYTDIINSINKQNAFCIGIFLNINNYVEVINKCDGIIFQGGDEILNEDLIYIKYCYDINKPVLGICLGMQEMGILFNGNLSKVINHKKKLDFAHEVIIDNSSLLYDIYNKESIKVNSRHNYALTKTDLYISARSIDNVIEAIEDKNKKFFVGIQWHPESMSEYNALSNELFKYFVNTCKIDGDNESNIK